MNKIYCGIDVGLKGAIAFVFGSHAPVISAKMPVVKNGTKAILDLQKILEILDEFKPDMVGVEKVHAMPGQGVSSTFTFGYGCGAIEGLLVARKLPYIHVTPQTWQKTMFEGVEASLGKKRSIVVANKLWPGGDNLNDGQADALCIAEWVRRTNR